MTGAEQKFAALASLIVTVSVGLNLFLMQESRRGGASVAVAPVSRQAPLTTGGIAPQAPPQSISEAIDRASPRPAEPAAPEEPAMNLAEVTRGVQRELNSRGYEAGPPDGVAGNITRAAIMAYENDFGLPLTARSNEALLSRIVLGSSAPPAGVTASDARLTAEAESVVRMVKQLLTEAGYQPGKIDGAVTPQLRRNIRQFEIDQKLPESARISAPLLSRLIRMQAATAAKGRVARAPAR